MNEKTRFKLVLLLIALFLIEAILKTIFRGFPLTELYAAQTLVSGAYTAAKTYSNTQESKNGQNKS